MKLAEIGMGHEAVDMARGQLSPAEAVLVEPVRGTVDRETLEGLLYLQLDTARRARRHLNAKTWSPGDENFHREREQAIERAREYYTQLEAAGGVPADLAAFAFEEIAP
jgi:hypothetical protein